MYEIFDPHNGIAIAVVPFKLVARLTVWFMTWTTREYVDCVSLDWAKRDEGW